MMKKILYFLLSVLILVAVNLHAQSGKNNPTNRLNSLPAQWQTTCQPAGITYVISNDSNLYINNNGQDIYLSQDKGKTWTTIDKSLPHGWGIITTIFVNNGIIFAGTNESGLYGSSDNGKNWFHANSGMPSNSYIHISTLYSLGDTLFVSTFIGDAYWDTARVFRSVNGGLYWTAADSGLPNSVARYNQFQYYGEGVSAFTSIGSTLYAAYYNNSSYYYGIYKSTNYGASWSNVLNDIYVFAFGSSGGNLLVSEENVVLPFNHYFLVSTDGGLTWQSDSANGLPAQVMVNAIASSGSEVFASTLEGSAAIVGGGVYRSTDNGINWASSSKGIFGTPTFSNFAFQDTTIYVAYDNNLFRSNDGGNNWNLISNGLPGVQDSNSSAIGNMDIQFGSIVYTLAEKGSKLFAGASVNGGVDVSTDAGITWSPANYGLPNPPNRFISAMTVSDSVLIVSEFRGDSSFIYRSTNDGANWTEVNQGMSIVKQLAAIGTNVIAATSSGGFLSTDGGISWTSLYGTGGFPTVKPINVAFAQNSVFFAGGGSSGIVRSTNGGTVWAVADSGIWPNVSVSSIGGDGTNVYAATTSGLFKSSDNGISWTSLNNSFLSPYSDYLSSLAGGGGAILAFTTYLSNGFEYIFLSTDGGSSWTEINNGAMYNNFPSALVFNGKLFLGLGGGNPWGVWFCQLPTATSVNDNFAKGSPSNFELEQNYPNPFNPSTTIKYSIPKFGLVTIKIYDILGREVKTLVNEEKNAGNYKFEFNASKLASGVYLYRMQAGSFVQAKKLILMK
jgi:photosystem II stability/assembly factor-like uncharacterized protein